MTAAGEMGCIKLQELVSRLAESFVLEHLSNRQKSKTFRHAVTPTTG